MYTTPLIKDVLILGAGIAGCALALALVKRGVSVTLATFHLIRESIMDHL